MPKADMIGQVTLHGAPEAHGPHGARNDVLFSKRADRCRAPGGQSQDIEGDGFERRAIAVSPGYADALAAHGDPEYLENLKIRQAVPHGQIIVVEGV